MKKILLGLIAFGLLLNSGFANLKLIITKGVSSAVPIAIVPFGGQTKPASDSLRTIASVIHNDLKNSGHFRVMDVTKIQQRPSNFSSVNFNYWKQTKNEYLVVGNVQPIGDAKFQVTFSLLNVYLGNSNQAPAVQNPIVISKRFVVAPDQFRNLAHRISDIVYHQITGVRGIFSTKIAYVLVQRKPEQSGQSSQAAKYMLEVTDADGFNPRPLVTSSAPLMSPAWSPNAKQIAYVSLANQQASINVVDVASGKQTLISDFRGINGAPAWSPDGKNLALVLSKTGHPKIYVYNLQSRQLKQMTFGLSIDTEPNFAPNGQSFVFTSNRGGEPQVYQYMLASGKISRVTFDGNYNARPAFIDDGKKIVVLHRATEGFNIAVQTLASGSMTVLTTNNFDSSPSPAPNGQMIIYANDETAQGTLGIVSIDGKIQLNLPSPEGTVLEPAWAPFQKTDAA